MRNWHQSIPESERSSLDREEGRAVGPRAALVVVDVTLGFTGSRGLTAERARAEWSTAAGPVAWEAIPRIASLIELARRRAAPVVYTRSSAHDQRFVGRATKKERRGEGLPSGFGDFADEIAPLADEWVLEKAKASAFFQTPLTVYLARERIDTVIVCGVSTSGCVRATAVDSCSNGYTTFVVDDASFDRSWFAHCSNLFDMNAKYADVLSVNELEEKWNA